MPNIPAPNADDTKLSSAITVRKYRLLERAGDRKALAQFVRDRFQERYFRPIDATPAGDKHGFAIMAVCCLVIETLESFYQGKESTRGCSQRMFRDFFARNTGLRSFGGADDWFYRDIRCGILHQSEARRGWRIRRSGPLLDLPAKRINATKFMRELRKAVEEYSDLLRQDDASWRLFKKKMTAICANCQD